MTIDHGSAPFTRLRDQRHGTMVIANWRLVDLMTPNYHAPQPIPRSSTLSSGVPHWRQITA